MAYNNTMYILNALYRFIRNIPCLCQKYTLSKLLDMKLIFSVNRIIHMYIYITGKYMHHFLNYYILQFLAAECTLPEKLQFIKYFRKQN